MFIFVHGIILFPPVCAILYRGRWLISQYCLLWWLWEYGAQKVGTLIIMDCFNIDKQPKIWSNKVPKHVHFKEPYDGQLNSSKVLIVICLSLNMKFLFWLRLLLNIHIWHEGNKIWTLSSILLWSVFLSAAIECISYVMLALIFWAYFVFPLEHGT